MMIENNNYIEDIIKFFESERNQYETSYQNKERDKNNGFSILLTSFNIILAMSTLSVAIMATITSQKGAIEGFSNFASFGLNIFELILIAISIMIFIYAFIFYKTNKVSTQIINKLIAVEQIIVKLYIIKLRWGNEINKNEIKNMLLNFFLPEEKYNPILSNIIEKLDKIEITKHY